MPCPLNVKLRWLAVLCAALVSGCVSPAARIDSIARRATLEREIILGAEFPHLIYTRRRASRGSWTIYLESDGLPWMNGRIPAIDPTARNPLALQLMLQVESPSLYVGRPCYHEIRHEQCSWQLWTQARYSEAVVSSMTAAIEHKLQTLNVERVTLVGYSGGGALAVLIAERLPSVERVITIAANLDTDAWTAHHGYLPLTESLNPANSSHAHTFEEVHLQGDNDKVVPRETTRSYFERFPNAQRITIEGFDHVCCWQERWTQLLSQLTTNN
jgi:predicted alpha/beta hydrolase family esterase